MKQKDHYNNRLLKLSYKKISLISFVIILSIGITVYYEVGSAQSQMKMEPIIMHIHPKLNITIDNNTTMVPAQVGIDQPIWNNHTLDNYGMQAMQGMSGMAPLHTHDNSGTIHVESSVIRNYTLGDFFNIWGLNLADKTVNATVDGKSIADFKNHILKDGEQINLYITSRR